MTPRRPPTALTFDIWDMIIDIFGYNSYEDQCRDTKTLNELSQTCKAMVPLCRKHLFSSLYLNEDLARSTRLNDAISQDPRIILYIRSLEYYICEPHNRHNYAVLDKLRDQSVVLQSVHLRHGNDWETIPSSFQVLLEELIHLPSVKNLRLVYMKRLPSTIFECPNLTHISLYHVESITPRKIPNGVELPQSIPYRSRPVYLQAMYSTDSIKSLMRPQAPMDQQIIDFTNLRDVTFHHLRKTEDVKLIWDILQIATEVESLQLSFSGRQISLTGLGAALAAAILRKLTVWQRQVEFGDQDPLRGLVGELKSVSAANVLEEIKLCLSFDVDEAFPVIMEALAAFDALFAPYSSFPECKTVSVDLTWSCYSRISPERVRDGIKAHHFPRLVEKDGLDFSLSVDMSCVCQGLCEYQQDRSSD